MELYRNVHQIQALFGGGNLCQYLLVSDHAVLLDTGIAETPEKVIFPAMDRLKLKPARVSLAVVTHADLDHQGGSDAIKRISPQTKLGCGAANRAMAEDPRALFDLRYNHLRAEHDVGLEPEPRPEGRTRWISASRVGRRLV